MWIPQAVALGIMPSKFWSKMHEWLRTPARMTLRVYHTEHVKPFVYVLWTFFLLPDTKVITFEDETKGLEGLEGAKDIWLMTMTGVGEKTYNLEALHTMLSHSPLLAHVLPLFSGFGKRKAKARNKHKDVERGDSYVRPGSDIDEALRVGRRAPTSGWNWKDLCFDFVRIRMFSIKKSSYHHHRDKRRPWWHLHLWKELVGLIYLTAIMYWNIAGPNGDKSDQAKGFFYTTRLDQYWGMFSPEPPRDDGWYVIHGYLNDGTPVDVLRNKEGVSWDKPTLISSEQHRDSRWSQFLDTLRGPGQSVVCMSYGKYICRQWNWFQSPPLPEPKKLANFTISFMLERTLPDYKTEPVQQLILWNHLCH